MAETGSTDRRAARAALRAARRRSRRAPIASATSECRTRAREDQRSARRASASAESPAPRGRAPRRTPSHVGRVGLEAARPREVRPHGILGKERDRPCVGPREPALGRRRVARHRPPGELERLGQLVVGSASLAVAVDDAVGARRGEPGERLRVVGSSSSASRRPRRESQSLGGAPLEPVGALEIRVVGSDLGGAPGAAGMALRPLA